MLFHQCHTFLWRLFCIFRKNNTDNITKFTFINLYRGISIELHQAEANFKNITKLTYNGGMQTNNNVQNKSAK